MAIDRLSPWTGLSSSATLELQDAMCSPELLPLEAPEAAWSVHVAYSRRAAAALVSNDLRLALRAAEIAQAALTIAQSAPQFQRRLAPVVDQDPTAANGTEPTPPARPAHRRQSLPARDVRR